MKKVRGKINFHGLFHVIFSSLYYFSPSKGLLYTFVVDD